MNKKILLTLLILFVAALSVSAISASDANVTDSYATNLVDDTSDVSVPLENTADSSEISVSSDSNVDNGSSKGSLSSEEALESDDSNILSTNSSSNDLLSSDNGVADPSALDNNASDDGNDSSKIDVSKTITAKDVTKYYKGSTQYSATFLDAYGNPLANTNVKITVNGVSYTKKTNANGVASLAVNLKPGTYKVVAVNPATGYSLTKNFKILSTISASDITKVYTDNRKFTATFYKSNGKVLANKNIKFKINGKTYKVKTNSKGVASLSLTNLKKGTYKIISYNTDGLTKTNKVKVVTYTTSSLTTKTYTFLKSDTKKVKVKLLNGLGYAPGKGKIINFKINGKIYSARTNAYGNAAFKLPSLSAGVYTVKYKFAGNVFYKKSVVYDKVYIIATKNPTFTVKSTTSFGHGANTPFKVALTAGKVPLAKRTVTLTLNGKTYTKTTDSNGIVSLPINLDIGKYTVTYKNKAESKVNSKTGSTAITVKERTPTSVTWKSGTSFNQGTQTYKILLKNSDGQALANKNVKLTVNSKTYTATTSSSGYATFTASVGAGNFTVSYSFAGDNDYLSSTGSTKIESKKVVNSNGYGYWVFGSDMKNVNLNTLASQGTSDLFLNFYAFTAHGQSAVESWIASANKLGIRVHIWMQAFYDGDWVNPVKNGAPNQAFFDKKIAEAKTYAKVKGVSGVHIDYIRYPGNAYATSGGTAAINSFAKQISEAVHGINSNLIVSCALMPETTDNKYYYGQDMDALSKYMDVVIPMIYKGNYNSGTTWIKTTTKWFVDHSKGAKVWAGLQGYVSDDNTAKLPSSEIKGDSQAAINGGGAGVIIFRWGLTNFVSFKSLTGYLASSEPIASSESTTDDAATPATATGTATTSSAGTISIANIIAGAKTVKSYYEANKKVPTSVSAGGQTFTAPEFLYLMSQAIYQLGNSNTKDIAIIKGVANPESPSGDAINQELYTADYVTVAKNVANFIVKNNQAPNYASSAVGNIIYSELVDSFSRVLAFYGNNDKLMPNYVTIVYGSTSSSSSSGSVSITGAGLNEKNTLSDVSAYLKATSNCPITNSAIKSTVNSLISGLTTTKEKAVAIYNYVRDKISYSFYYDTKYGAAGTLSYKTGNCVDQAHLLVSMYRTAGIAARYVHGTCVFSSGSTYGHVWVQVLVDNVWTCVDPTSSRNSFGVINNWNTKSFSLNSRYASLPF
ncbi:transglutaminase domain-containing protein [Methanobrevibacter sp.]|uniref:transglutaminase domain-containing protein n=1 Tax=Methanobrevibacter sp. TaxID=66852 RepID=UPI0038665CFB